MRKVTGSRRPKGTDRRPKKYNFTHFIVGVLFVVSLVGIFFLSFIMNDPVSFGWGVLIGFVLIVVFYILWKKAPQWDLNKRPSHVSY